jgi:polyhydroxybutyrate depolymerase
MRLWLCLALGVGVSAVAACGSAGGDSPLGDAGGAGGNRVGENAGDAGSGPDATLTDDTTDGGSAGDDEVLDGGATATEAAAPIVCPTAALDAGDSTNTLILDGGGRTYNVHIPAGLDLSKPAPLVFAFHGGGQSISQYEGFVHLVPKSDSAGFILIEPEGTISIPGLSPGTLDVWNAGNCCELAAQINTNVDDVGFVRAMLDTITTQVCIDPKRVFATGFSNGGMLSHRLACELSDKIAAIASVSGGIGDVNLDKMPPETLFQCNPGRQVPVMHIHGTQDACYPFDGGWGPLSLVTFVSAPTTVQEWVARNGCTPDAGPTNVLSNGAASCNLYPCPHAGEVEFCTIDGGGHYWPGGDDWAGSEVFCGSNQGIRSADLIANDTIWSWFLAHPMP